MDLKCALLLYLDDRRYLFNMKTECENFLFQMSEKELCKFPPLRCKIEIDIMDMINVFADIFIILIKEPMKLQKIFNDILFAVLLATDNEMKNSIAYAQVSVVLRFRSMPMLTPPNSHNYVGLVNFDGLLISFSKPESYVYHSVWSCPEECEGNEVVLHFIPKHPPKCIICKSNLFENGGWRRCGEKVIATFKLKNELLPKKFIIVDDLIMQLNLGSRYILHANVTKKVTTIWSVEKIILLPSSMTSPIPKEVKELYKACHGIPWKFIYCLASSIGVNVCPLNCFMHLKISILLSLTSVKANAAIGSSIIHILVAGFDSRYIPALMTEAAKLADRHVSLGITNTVPPTALIGSSGGVCFLPLPLHVYSHKQVSSILSAIETGEIIVGTGVAKLKSAVWAQGMDFKKMILFNVSSVFSYVCRGDFGEYNDEIADFLLQQAMDPVEISKEEKRALKDVIEYVDLVSGIEVILEEKTEHLLRSYFLAARKENSRSASIGSMVSLIATCMNSARLCHRRVTNIDDAVFAIWLHVSGSPEPRFAPEEYLQTPADVKKLQKVMNKFKDWLEQFIGDFL